MRLPLPFHLEKLVYSFISLEKELTLVRSKLKRPTWIVMYADTMDHWMYLRVNNRP